MYAFYGLLALTSLVSAEMAIHNHHLLPSSGIDSTGQVIALVIASATVLRAAWLFVFLFMHEHSEMHGLYWPFHLNQSFFASAQPYIRSPPFTYQPDFLPLGSLLRDPFDFHSKYNSHIPVQQEDLHHSTISGWTKTDIKSWNLSFYGLISCMFSRGAVTRADSMETIRFDPKPEYLRRYATQPEIQSDFGVGTKTVTVYVVSSVMIATGLSITSSHTKTIGISAAAPLNSGVGLPVAVGANVEEQKKDNSSFSVDRLVLYGYTVQEVTITSDGHLI